MTSASELHQRLGTLGYSPQESARLSGLVERVRALKARRKAVLLAHSYQRPEIFEAADVIGDSLVLARKAVELKGDVIVMCGVHFMAETARILNPSRPVLLPDLAAGCSLAEMAEAEALSRRIEELKREDSDLAVVSYVNTSAAVKALSDIVCTSANAVKVVNSLPNRRILFVPDRNLGAWCKRNTGKEIITWDGFCYVHDEITAGSVAELKRAHPLAKVVAHPECREEVLEEADEVLSTEGMFEYVGRSDAREFIMVTERGFSNRLRLRYPDRVFLQAFQECKYMKSITLEDVVESLEKMQYEVTVPEDVRVRAERAISRMLDLSSAPAPARRAG